MEEIKQNDLMKKKKTKKIYTVSNYIEQLLISLSTITGCVSIFSFALLVGIPIGIARTELELKICMRN